MLQNDVGLWQYAAKHLTKHGVRLLRGVVKEVQPKKIVLSDGSDVPYGLLVWSTGVGPSEFAKSLNLPKSPGGRIGVDEWLRVPSVEDVFALGDCAGFLEQTGRPVLPALAQVAERQGKYLVELINKVGKQNGGKAFSKRRKKTWKQVARDEIFLCAPLHQSSSVHHCLNLPLCTTTSVYYNLHLCTIVSLPTLVPLVYYVELVRNPSLIYSLSALTQIEFGLFGGILSTSVIGLGNLFLGKVS